MLEPWEKLRTVSNTVFHIARPSLPKKYTPKRLSTQDLYTQDWKVQVLSLPFQSHI